MPSPQSLVVFLLCLFLLLVVTRAELGLSANVAAVTSLLIALALAWFVDKQIPADDEEGDEVEGVSSEEPTESGTREH